VNVRRLVVFAYDVLVAGAAWVVAFWLRFNLDVPPDYAEVMLTRLPLVVALHAVVFWTLGLYRGMWRYASLPDLQRIVLAVGLAALAVPTLLAMLRLGVFVPRSST